MKVLPAFFLGFTLFGSFTAAAHAGHEISHFIQRHAGQDTDAEIEDQDAAHQHGGHRHGQYRRYGYGHYASDDPETNAENFSNQDSNPNNND